MSRPYTSNEFTVQKGVRMTEEMAGRLARYASRHDVSEGEVMRQALEKYLGLRLQSVDKSVTVDFEVDPEFAKSFRVVNEQTLQEAYDGD